MSFAHVLFISTAIMQFLMIVSISFFIIIYNFVNTTTAVMIVPKYFLKKKFLNETVVLNTVFSMVFLAVYQPFSQTFWLGVSPTDVLLHSVAFYLCCIVFMLASKEGFHRYESARKELPLSSLVMWMLCEFAGIAVIYLAFTFASGYSTDSSLPELLVRVTGCVALILSIPMVPAVLYAKTKDDQEEIRILKLNQAASSRRVEGTSLVNLFDHSGALKITASQDDIFFIESQDNYVCIHYLIGDKMENYLLRSSTQDVEASLKGTGIIRCHRSYLVNINRIKVLKHDKGRAVIVMEDRTGSEVPVSRSYYKELLEVIVPGKIIRNT